MNKNDMDEIRQVMLRGIEDKPQAFPSVLEVDGASFFIQGMTLRDWFAGRAMANLQWYWDYDNAKSAEMAYRIADAMLAARDRNQGAAIAKAEGRAEG